MYVLMTHKSHDNNMKGTVILKVSGNKVSNDNYTAYVMRQTVNENITSNNSLCLRQ